MPRKPAPEPTPGERVRAARTAAGLSQSQLAAATDSHHDTISKVERGTTALSVALALKISEATGVSPGLILPGLPVGAPKTCPHCGHTIG